MATDPLFRMRVEDVFSIRGRGTIVTGHIERGSLQTGDEVELGGPGYSRTVVVTAIEMFRKPVKQAGEGDYVGLVLEALAKEEVQRGDILSGSKGDLGETGA